MSGAETEDEEWSPAPRRRGLGFLYFIVAVAVAFGGGILATVAYDRAVEVPEPKVADARVSEPLANPEPDAALDSPRIDPYLQAIAAARAQLGENALLDVSVRAERGLVFLIGEADSRRTVATATEVLGAVSGVRAVDTRSVRIVNRTHRFAPGETLSKVALKYYGQRSEWRRIAEANPSINPDRVPVGAELQIPPRDR